MINLTSNRISHVMTAEQFAATKAELQKVTDHLDFLIQLSSSDMGSLFNMSDADKTFVRNCVTEINSAGDVVPSYLKAEDISEDLTCGEQLLELENILATMLEHVRRNRRLANYEAYNGASVFYRLIGAAARSGHAPAQAIYDRMQTYHTNKKRNGRAAAGRAAQQKEPAAN